MKSNLRLFQLILLLIAGITACSQKSPVSNNLTPFATGLSNPVCIANCGDSRLFVVDQFGYIRIVDSAGSVNPAPFLDIHQRVTAGGELGLLGVAFHPQYFTNGYFYVNYTGNGDSTHISRFSVSPGNPDVADTLSEFKLMTIYQPFTNHKGGDLNFGPDNYLYLGLGDGGSAGDPGNRAQNLMDYHGKMLRIDVDHGNPYAIPSTNPFYNNPLAHGEIWAYGLRNPWRFSFDRLTGDLWIGDVGQNLIEEVDMQSAASQGGENYGWRCYEGNQPYNMDSCSASRAFTFPVYTYPHDPECSITGGYVYRGSLSSSYYGYYFFADYCSGMIWTLHNESGNWIKAEYGSFPGNGFSTFGEDAGGQLYVAGLNIGIIYHLVTSATGISAAIPSGIKIIQEPSSDLIRIENDNSNYTEMQLTLCDVRGASLFTASTGNNRYELNISRFPAGTYFLKIRYDGKELVHKVVKGR